jgi:hypothetical protein
MSSTTTTATTQPPLTLTLQNGQNIRFHSDTSIEADEIPVIDITGIFSDDIADRKAVAAQVREAAHRIGFFYIINHGIEDKYAAATFAEAKRFFGQEEEEKMTVCTDLVEEYLGYFPMARVSPFPYNSPRLVICIADLHASTTATERNRMISWKRTTGATTRSTTQWSRAKTNLIAMPLSFCGRRSYRASRTRCMRIMRSCSHLRGD